ncbi:MAG TPA: hypothetical protein VGP26_15925 [Actinophytocola sp.]|jgi:hypothetical protein|nr:hypothetical protein [Actinophytocola sp.]
MTDNLRTVCHMCRQVTQYRDDAGNVSPMVLPGNGTVWIDRSPGGLVEEPCPECGNEDDPGWLPGFEPPV